MTSTNRKPLTAAQIERAIGMAFNAGNFETGRKGERTFPPGYFGFGGGDARLAKCAEGATKCGEVKARALAELEAMWAEVMGR